MTMIVMMVMMMMTMMMMMTERVVATPGANRDTAADRGTTQDIPERPDQPRYYYNCNVACCYGDDKGDYDNLKHTACTTRPPYYDPTNTSFTAYLASNYDSSWHSITLLIDTYNTNTS